MITSTYTYYTNPNRIRAKFKNFQLMNYPVLRKRLQNQRKETRKSRQTPSRLQHREMLGERKVTRRNRK